MTLKKQTLDYIETLNRDVTKKEIVGYILENIRKLPINKKTMDYYNWVFNMSRRSNWRYPRRNEKRYLKRVSRGVYRLMSSNEKPISDKNVSLKYLLKFT